MTDATRFECVDCDRHPEGHHRGPLVRGPLTPETADRVLPFRALSNDLFADFRCGVPRPGSALGHLVRVPNGYNDAYFFNVVSAENKVVTCECGKRYLYRWTPGGVLLAEAPHVVPAPDRG